MTKEEVEAEIRALFEVYRAEGRTLKQPIDVGIFEGWVRQRHPRLDSETRRLWPREYPFTVYLRFWKR